MTRGTWSMELGMRILLLFSLFFALSSTVIACPNMSTSFVEGRYRDSTISGFNISCNGTAAAACNYHINDFANVTISNCSSGVILAELGWNRAVLCGSNGSAWNCTNQTFWAKKLSGNTSSDYAVIVLTLVVSVGLFLLGSFLRSKLFWFVGSIGGLILGYELLALSMVSGLCVVLCSALLCLGVLFRKGERT